jgi:hypothetical protein
MEGPDSSLLAWTSRRAGLSTKVQIIDSYFLVWQAKTCVLQCVGQALNFKRL